MVNKLEVEYIYSEKVAIESSKEFTKRVNVTFKYGPFLGYFMIGSIVLAWIATSHIGLASLIPLVIGIYLSSLPIFTLIEAKKKYKVNPSAGKLLKYSIDNNIIEMNTDGAELKISWTHILKVEKLKKGYLLYTQTRSAHWLPISSMDDGRMKILEKIINQVGLKFKNIS